MNNAARVAIIALSIPLLGTLLGAAPAAPSNRTPTARHASTTDATTLAAVRSLPTMAAQRLREHAGEIGTSVEIAIDLAHRPGVPDALESGTMLRLERFEIFAPTARIESIGVDARGARTTTVHPLPNVKLFRGVIAGVPDSRVFLGVTNDRIDGWILDGELSLVVSSGPRGAALPPIVFDPTAVPPSTLPPTEAFCNADLLPPVEVDWLANRDAAAEGGVAGGSAVGVGCATITMAVDSDHAYLQLFGGNIDAATAYAAIVFAGSSEIFVNDLNVRLELTFLRLFETPEQPWQTNNTFDRLFEFRDHWVAQMTHVDRMLAHLISGEPLGGGIAWLPGMCSELFSFAVSANLGGSFPYPFQQGNQNWDLIVITHEIGHNIGAPHTHNEPNPPELCGAGDCSGSANGTIMSYCHLCSGGIANMQLRLADASILSINNFFANASCLNDNFGGVWAVGDSTAALQGDSVLVDVLLNDAGANCESVSLLGFDAVSALGGAVTLCAGCGAGGTDALQYAAVGDAGPDTFTYTIIGESGATSTATVAVDVLALRDADVVIAPTPGAVASYYALVDPVVLPDFSTLTPYLSEIVPLINYPSTNGNFAGSGLADNVGAVFEGYLDIPTAGVWTLFTESDDGSRLLIGDQVVVDNDGLHGMLEKSGTIALAAGTHAVRVEFFERGGGAGLIVRAAGPGFAKQVVPAPMWLWSDAPKVVGDLNGDGIVDGADLGILLQNWGACSGCAADFNGDGVIDGADLGILLQNWS